jgi:methionyl-tRNA formyltransferase
MVRTVFMGTPEFAVATLRSLVADPGFELVGVVTQPDRLSGRGQQVAASAVKQAAVELDLPIFQPERLRDPGAFQTLSNWNPGLIVVAAFGQILRKPVLELPRYGCINVHASLLPRWRGAAPIQYAIRAGDPESGVTIMRMDEGLDTGPMLAQVKIPLAAAETAASLHDKLAVVGADLLIPTLHHYVDGTITPTPQPDAGITLAPTLTKQEGEINWTMPAFQIDRLVRAFNPWPGAYTFLGEDMLKIIAGDLLSQSFVVPIPGTVLKQENDLFVQTGEGLYRVLEIQPAGKKKMTGQAYLAGHPEAPGTVLGYR